MTSTSTSTSTRKRALSLVLLAVHFAVLLFSGGASVANASTARVAAHRAVVTALAAGGDGSAVVTPARARLELGTRPRGDRGERSTAFALPDAIVTRGTPAVAPAAFAGTLTFASTSRELRPRPSIVNAPRGPPQARFAST
ncbi:MAG: hypothetical protein JWP87_2905 [Labilithrix sp.]|nr:hypothetical protein [Labilithrix sp.]